MKPQLFFPYVEHMGQCVVRRVLNCSNVRIPAHTCLTCFVLRLNHEIFYISISYKLWLYKYVAQVHFRILTCSITSVTFVFSLTQMFALLSRYVIFNILLFIFVCVVDSLFFAWLVSAHVSELYVIAGSMHELQTCFFKHVPVLPLMMYRCLTNCVHPAVIFL